MPKCLICDNIYFTILNERGVIRRNILIGAGVVTLLVLLTTPAVGNALLAMLFLGVIPGTSVTVPTWMILVGSTAGSYLAIRWILNQPLFIGNRQYQEKLARQLARKKVLAMTATPTPVAVTVRPRRINAANRRRVKA